LTLSAADGVPRSLGGEEAEHDLNKRVQSEISKPVILLECRILESNQVKALEEILRQIFK